MLVISDPLGQNILKFPRINILLLKKCDSYDNINVKIKNEDRLREIKIQAV